MAHPHIFEQALGAKLTSKAAEELGGMVTAMYAIVEYITGDGDQRVCFTVAPDQKATTSAGLLALSASISEFELRSYIGEMYSPDDDHQD